jgi:internalin A
MKTMLSLRRRHYLVRVGIFLIGLTLIAGMVGCGPPSPSAVIFADPNLEAAVRVATSTPQGPIYPSDLDGLTSLNASAKSIANLGGLEQCTSLKELGLYDNQLGDISALADLTGLEQLDLSCNHQIRYLSPLANLTRLKSLYLQNNWIAVISPLGNLTSLRLLSLWGNEIRDISPLADLTGLTQLYLASNQIRDISPLASLSNLTYLDLEDNQIEDIFPLLENEGFSEGDQIDLRGNPLSADSISICIPELEARGVIVTWQGGTSPHA